MNFLITSFFRPAFGGGSDNCSTIFLYIHRYNVINVISVFIFPFALLEWNRRIFPFRDLCVTL
jgi:hypothetical protein